MAKNKGKNKPYRYLDNMKIALNSEIIFKRDNTIKAVYIGKNTLRYLGKDWPITRLTHFILNGSNPSNVYQYWTYDDGERLDHRYARLQRQKQEQEKQEKLDKLEKEFLKKEQNKQAELFEVQSKPPAVINAHSTLALQLAGVFGLDSTLNSTLLEQEIIKKAREQNTFFTTISTQVEAIKQKKKDLPLSFNVV